MEACFYFTYSTMMLRYAVGCAIQVSCSDAVFLAHPQSHRRRGGTWGTLWSCMTELLHLYVTRYRAQDACMFESESDILYFMHVALLLIS